MDERDLWENRLENRDATVDQDCKTYSLKKRLNHSIITVIIIALLVGAGSGGLTAYLLTKSWGQRLISQPQNIEILPSDVELNTAALIAEKALPSVVGISTQVVYKSFWGDSIGEGVGTGVIIDKNGYILTNSHVVNDGNAKQIKVMLNDGKEIEGKVLWNDTALDLAIVKVDKINLTPAVLGDSTNIRVGEYAVAIGNPLGFQFEKSVTQGIISGLNRSIQISQFQSIDDLIQTDASINPGNSGGPLLNQYGEVIGINTAKIQTGEGLGFAIPIHVAKPIVDSFIKEGSFTKSYLGIRGVDLEEYASSLPESVDIDKGVYVYQVFTDSPASKGGLQEGDIIVQIGDRKIDRMTQLSNQLYQYKPGDILKMKIYRDGRPLDIELTLEKQPADFQ
ncbi:MAG: trypsin-like peptidase domain-containing protein [Peptostreptococcales bacterium]